MPTLPPLELRTAYTQKGLALGLGGFFGHVLLGPYGALGGAFLGWMVGNGMAIRAERHFTLGLPV